MRKRTIKMQRKKNIEKERGKETINEIKNKKNHKKESKT